MRSTLDELRKSWVLLSTRGQRTLVAYAAALTLLSVLDAGALVLVSRLFTGDGTSVNTDFWLFAVVVILFVTRTALSTFASWWAIRVLAVEEVEIGTTNLSRLMSRGVEEEMSEADYYNGVDRGPSSLTQGLMMYSVTIVSEIATAIVILGTLLVLDFPTAISSSVYFLTVAFLQNRVLSRSAARAGETVTEQTVAVYESLTDGFKLRKLLLAMPSRTFASDLRRKRHLLAHSRARVAFLGTLPRYTMELVLSIGLIVVCGVAYLVSGEEGTVKALAIFGVAGFRLLPSINRIQGLVLLLFSTVPMARLAVIKSSDSDRRDPSTVPNNDNDILSMNQISFRYPGAAVEAVHEVSVRFQRGLQYAVIGPSGAGKTTLLDILLGLLEPSNGSLNRTTDLTIGYVPQDTHLARTSFDENIALEWGLSNVDSVMLARVVKATSLDAVAERFRLSDSDRMNDNVTSGGQRQRIGLARALYRQPNLLVLDEVTSALDTETEHFVMEHVRSLRGQATVIIVAHRLTTVQHADQVIYMENGHVLGVGSFEELRQALPQLQRQIELGTLDLSS